MSIPSCWLSRGLALIALALCPAVTRAGVPEVQADIAPVHSLVARVMAGVGEPGLIVDAGASPHSFALRPSQARALQDADLVFWVGPELEPWLSDAMITLTEDAVAIALFDAPETRRIAAREAALFDGDHDHDHDHDRGDDHAEAQDDDHAEGHDHGADDPHAWLDPENAIAWLGVIAEALAGADPDNAALYRANAAAGAGEIAAVAKDVDALLAPVRAQHFIVYHDAFQYFETAFGLTAAGALSISDASPPSPARLAAIRARVSEAGITCALAEPQFDPRLLATVSEGTGLRSGVLDPLGAGLEPGPGLYPALLQAMGSALSSCLK